MNDFPASYVLLLLIILVAQVNSQSCTVPNPEVTDSSFGAEKTLLTGEFCADMSLIGGGPLGDNVDAIRVAIQDVSVNTVFTIDDGGANSVTISLIFDPNFF